MAEDETRACVGCNAVSSFFYAHITVGRLRKCSAIQTSTWMVKDSRQKRRSLQQNAKSERECTRGVLLPPPVAKLQANWNCVPN